jgi:hypothetical protein
LRPITALVPTTLDKDVAMVKVVQRRLLTDTGLPVVEVSTVMVLLFLVGTVKVLETTCVAETTCLVEVLVVLEEELLVTLAENLWVAEDSLEDMVDQAIAVEVAEDLILLLDHLEWQEQTTTAMVI